MTDRIAITVLEVPFLPETAPFSVVKFVKGLFSLGKAARTGGVLTETVSGILKPGGNIIGKAGSNASIRELSGRLEAAQSYWSKLVTSGESLFSSQATKAY